MENLGDMFDEQKNGRRYEENQLETVNVYIYIYTVHIKPISNTYILDI